MTENKKPDIVIMDREVRSKCSIYPLRYREDLRFMHSNHIPELPEDTFADHILLHVDGEPLTLKDRNTPMILIDASWKRALYLAKFPQFQNLQKRSLCSITTSYPRVSKLYKMPGNGLASVEALYIARIILGKEDITLLDHYHWREQFLESNKDLIASLKESQATNFT